MMLDALGPRICIVGPSNSGKSTLASAIERSRGLPAVHLDRLYHRPETDWEPRPLDEFLTLHDDAIGGPAWVMDGNYSLCLSQRLQRATGVIRLDVSTTVSLVRYFRRTWFESERRGALDGGKDSVKWGMVKHIVVTTRRNRSRDLAVFERIESPKLRLSTRRSLAAFYRIEGLEL